MKKTKKNLSYSALLYRKNKTDPARRVVERNLNLLLENTNEKQMIEKLKDLGMPLKLASYKFMLKKSSLSAACFIKLMIAAKRKQFTLNVTEEEIENIKKWEKEN